MKKVYVLGAVLGMLMTAVPALAYQYVDGHRTVATDTQVVIGGQVFDVKADPQTIEDMQNKVSWLQERVDEAVGEQNALKATNCSK